MTSLSILRLRYARSLVMCLLGISLYMMFQSMTGGIAQFDANVPGRQSLITIFTRLRLKLGDHVFSQALVGKDGWMEYTGDVNLDNFQNSPTLPAGAIEAAQSGLEKLYERLRERHITLVVVIAPNKGTIYPDKIPAEIQKIGAQSELDLLVNYVQQHGPPVLIDLRPDLRKARLHREVYYKTDTHWNGYGAFVAYRDIMRALSQTYPELAPRNANEFKLTTVPPYVHDLPRIIGATNVLEAGFELAPKKEDLSWIVYNDDRNPMMVSYSPRDDLPRLLMYFDSFGGRLTRLLAPQFSEATFIQNGSAYRDLTTYKEVDAFKPDIVIVEFVERSQSELNAFLDNFGLDSMK